MEIDMKVNFKMVIEMEMEYYFIIMAIDMLVNIEMAIKKEKGLFIIKAVPNMKDI